MNHEFPLRDTHREAFDFAVKLLRTGSSSLDVEDALTSGCYGLSGSAPALIAEARRFLSNQQTLAFEDAVVAYENGESDFEVRKRLEACGIHPFECGVIAARAKRKAGVSEPEPEDTTKKLSEAEALIARLRRESIAKYAAMNPEFAAEVAATNAEISEHAAQLEAKRNAVQVIESPERDAFLLITNRWSNDGKQSKS